MEFVVAFVWARDSRPVRQFLLSRRATSPLRGGVYAAVPDKEFRNSSSALSRHLC